MDNYRIVLTPQSYKDLDDVYAVVLRLSADKETARNYIETIKAAIRKLTTFPKRGTIRTTGKFIGNRQIFIKEYTVINRVNDHEKKIIILTIKPKSKKTKITVLPKDYLPRQVSSPVFFVYLYDIGVKSQKWVHASHSVLFVEL